MSSAEQPDTESANDIEHHAPKPKTTCPHVASFLDGVSEDSLEWLVHNFLWGEVSQYGLSQDGTIAFNQEGEQISADVKLELLIKLTRDRRENFCANPDVGRFIYLGS